MPASNAARPPAPTERRVIEPAAIVIRRPAPGIVADPGPAVPVVVHPASVPIRRPASRHAGNPNAAVLRIVGPVTVVVEVFRAIDVAADVLIGLRAFVVAVAILAPTIEFIALRRVDDLELRIVVGAAREHRAAGLQPFAASRREHFEFAGANRNFRGSVFANRDAILALLQGPQRHAGRIEFHLRFAVAHDTEHHRAPRDLDHVPLPFEFRQANFGIAGHAQQVRRVELQFRAGAGSGENTVGNHERSVDRGRHQIAGVAALDRYFAVHQADARDAAAGSVFILIRLLALSLLLHGRHLPLVLRVGRDRTGGKQGNQRGGHRESGNLGSLRHGGPPWALSFPAGLAALRGPFDKPLIYRHIRGCRGG